MSRRAANGGRPPPSPSRSSPSALREFGEHWMAAASAADAAAAAAATAAARGGPRRSSSPPPASAPAHTLARASAAKYVRAPSASAAGRLMRASKVSTALPPKRLVPSPGPAPQLRGHSWGSRMEAAAAMYSVQGRKLGYSTGIDTNSIGADTGGGGSNGGNGGGSLAPGEMQDRSQSLLRRSLHLSAAAAPAGTTDRYACEGGSQRRFRRVRSDPSSARSRATPRSRSVQSVTGGVRQSTAQHQEQQRGTLPCPRPGKTADRGLETVAVDSLGGAAADAFATEEAAGMELRQALSEAGVLRSLVLPRNYSPTLRPDDGVLFAESPLAVATPVVVRARQSRDAAPERLNLDKRNLSECCVLEGEERLRLLNYQHNAIRSISRLRALPNLVFLDLYSNALEEITGLEAVPLLRVLMLGRNRIQAISGLSQLRKLDVLDLHSNRIQRIEGLDQLHQLRVLNLAGNAIREVENIRSLRSLMELNLRRNVIEGLAPCNEGASAAHRRLPPMLRRLFLSHNRIESLSDADVLSECAKLTELALEGNPAVVAAQKDLYRSTIVAKVPWLQTLDLVPVTEEDRAAVGEQSGAAERKTQRDQDLEAITRQWAAAMRGEQDEPAPNGRESASAQARANAPVGLAELQQVSGVASRLVLYGDGPALTVGVEAHQREVTCVSLELVPWASVCSSLLPLLRRMPDLAELRIGECDVRSLAQVDVLAALSELKALEVDAKNPVVALKAFRMYTVHCLPSLTVLNGSAVTAAERSRAKAMFARVTTMRLRAAPKPHSEARRVSPESTPAGRASRAFVVEALKESLRAVEKVEALDQMWPGVALKLVEEGIAASRLEGARASRPRRSSVEMHIAALPKTGAIT